MGIVRVRYVAKDATETRLEIDGADIWPEVMSCAEKHVCYSNNLPDPAEEMRFRAIVQDDQRRREARQT